MEINPYICECGKAFDNPQAFNGHKSNCETHLKATGKYEEHLRLCEAAAKKRSAKLRQRGASMWAIKESAWIAEGHRCKRCGKAMTERFGRGDFCSLSCARSHERDEASRRKSSEATKRSYASGKQKLRYEARKAAYNENPTRCQICGKALPYKRRNAKVCCLACQYELESRLAIARCAEQGTNLCGKGLRGYYRGYYCQSSWELAYVIYCLEHDIKIERNKRRFSYTYEGKERSYFPDFYLPDECAYVEVKGYYDAKTRAKEAQFPEKLILMRKAEMAPILDYVRQKYGKDYTSLYDATMK